MHSRFKSSEDATHRTCQSHRSPPSSKIARAQPPLLFIATALIAGALGFLTSRTTRPEDAPTASASPVSAQSLSERTTSENVRALRRLRDNSTMAGGKTNTRLQRLRELTLAISRADAGELRQLFHTAVGLKIQTERDTAISLITSRWIDLDPASFVSNVLSGDSHTALNDRVEEAMQRWAKIDPDAAAKEIASIDSHWMHSRTTTALIAGIGAEDYGAALARAETINDPTLRSQALAAIGGHLAEQDPERAVLEMDQRDYTHATRACEIIAGKDPERACELLLQAKTFKRSNRTDLLHDTLATWATKNPEAAWDWHRSHKVEGTAYNDETSDAILRAWAKHDPLAALERVDDHPSATHRRGIISEVVAQWHQQDPAAALNYMDENLSPSHRIGAISKTLHVAVADGGNFNAEALLPLANELPLPSYTDRAAQFAQKWAHQDGVAATEWMATLPESTRNKATPPVIRAWASEDPATARNYVAEMPDGTLKTSAVNSSSYELLKGMEPADQLEWLGLLDEKTQEALSDQIQSAERKLNRP